MCAVVARAAADPASAQRARAEAEALAAKQQYVAAAAKFREAYAQDPRPDLICNVGIAYYKAKDLPHAQRYLAQCLDAGRSLDAPFLDRVTKVQAAVVGKLGAGEYTPVDLILEPVAATASIEGEEPIVGARRVWVAYGSYKVKIHAEAYVDHDDVIEAHAHEPVILRVVLERPAPIVEPPNAGSAAGSGSAAAASGSGSVAVGAGSGSAAVERTPPPPVAPVAPVGPVAQRSHTAAWIGTGVTGLAAITAITTFAIARSRASSAAMAPDPATYFHDIDSARSFQRTSWIAGGIAGAAALVTGYLWYRATRSVEVVPDAHGAAVVLSGRW